MENEQEQDRHSGRMFSGRPRALELIKTLVDGVVADCCARHYDGPTQEHQLTSRLAEALESKLNNISVSGLRLQVTVQELPDRGRSSLERPVGADLYISLGVDAGDQSFSKGLLVQSKWDDVFAGTPDRQLHEQIDKMLSRTPESYVWAYGSRGISIVPASVAREADGVRDPGHGARTVGDLISNGFACTAGDPNLGLRPGGDVVQGLNVMLRELGVGTAVSFTVSPVEQTT